MGSFGIHGYLGDTFQNFVSIATDIELCTVLKIAVVVLKTFFGGIYYRTVCVFECNFQVGFIFRKTCPVYPVQCNVGTVGAGPFGRMPTVLLYSFQNLLFKFCRELFLACTHLYQ